MHTCTHKFWYTVCSSMFYFYNMRVYLKFLFSRNYLELINILCCILLGKLIKSWWKKALEAGTCLTTADRSCSCRPSNVTVKLMMLAWMYTAGRKWGFDIDVVMYSLKYKGSLQVGCQTAFHVCTSFLRIQDMTFHFIYTFLSLWHSGLSVLFIYINLFIK